MMHGQKKHQVM